MMKLLQQKNTSLAAKLEAEQAETARLRKAHDKLRRAGDRARSELDAERAESARLRTRLAALTSAAAPPEGTPLLPAAANRTGTATSAGAAVVARRLAADREFAALAAAAPSPPPGDGTILPVRAPPHAAVATATFTAPPFIPSPPAVVRPTGLTPSTPRAAFDPLAFTGSLAPQSTYVPPYAATAAGTVAAGAPPPAVAPSPPSSVADVLGAFVVPKPPGPKEPFCPARHAAEEDEFGAIAGRTATQ
mmetsp:Transcript_26326/g.81024  ORF Transcript_26326/g.81024 Transcript_26326/m.81024 type:complete len:248 (+) Transcript_26326:1815-2558(+)